MLILSSFLYTSRFACSDVKCLVKRLVNGDSDPACWPPSLFSLYCIAELNISKFPKPINFRDKTQDQTSGSKVNSFNKHLCSSFCMPESVLNGEDTECCGQCLALCFLQYKKAKHHQFFQNVTNMSKSSGL